MIWFVLDWMLYNSWIIVLDKRQIILYFCPKILCVLTPYSLQTLRCISKRDLLEHTSLRLGAWEPDSLNRFVFVGWVDTWPKIEPSRKSTNQSGQKINNIYWGQNNQRNFWRPHNAKSRKQRLHKFDILEIYWNEYVESKQPKTIKKT